MSLETAVQRYRAYLRNLPDAERRLAVRGGGRVDVDGSRPFWIQRVGDKIFRDHPAGYRIWKHPSAMNRSEWVPGDTSSLEDVSPDIPALKNALNLLLVEEVLEA